MERCATAERESPRTKHSKGGIGRAIAVSLVMLSGGASADEPWWDPGWAFRVPVEVGGAGYERIDKPVEVALDFTALLATLGRDGALVPDSIRVVDAAAGALVPFQFDPAADFDPASRAQGEVVFVAAGPLGAGQTRRFHVYFDTAGGFDPPDVVPQVSVADGIQHEGQESFRVDAAGATWYFQKQGAGFASLEDADDNDWIGFSPAAGSGSAGEYRGIPNLGDWGHPGYDNAASSLVHAGPVRIRIRSETTDGAWEKHWDFLPGYARMTLIRAGGSYWFLYEGTPGGALDEDDFCVRSTGEQTGIGVDWHADLPAPEWVWFADPAAGRMIYLVHHQDDAHLDQFWQMQDNMTVFGFGREYTCCDRYMTEAPARFTVGLADVTDLAEATAVIDAAFRPLDVQLGDPQAQADQPDGGTDGAGDGGPDDGADAAGDSGGDAGPDADGGGSGDGTADVEPDGGGDTAGDPDRDGAGDTGGAADGDHGHDARPGVRGSCGCRQAGRFSQWMISFLLCMLVWYGARTAIRRT